jgi:hypothetical protein
MEAAQKVALEPLASALGVAAFLHNVIIVHTIISLVAGSFFMHYNATLCKEALGKKLLAQVAKRTCFCSKNCDSNFFWSVGKGVTTEM